MTWNALVHVLEELLMIHEAIEKQKQDIMLGPPVQGLVKGPYCTPPFELALLI